MLRSLRNRLLVFAVLVPALALIGAAPAAIGAGSGPAAEASKRKCPKGKVPRKGKCVKKPGKGVPGKGAQTPSTGGPQIPSGSYTCFDAGGTLYIHGGTYDVNNGTHYPYTYDPATKIVNFPTGDYSDFFGVYDADGKSIEIRADYSDEYTLHGAYLWTCSD